jgi:hypothetical protein
MTTKTEGIWQAFEQSQTLLEEARKTEEFVKCMEFHAKLVKKLEDAAQSGM